MIPTIIIGILIAGYAAYVVRKKIKDWKSGKGCGCSCGSCSGGCGNKDFDQE